MDALLLDEDFLPSRKMRVPSSPVDQLPLRLAQSFETTKSIDFNLPDVFEK